MRQVICPYCGAKFDRDKEPYALVSARRYAHAACMLREAEKDPKYIKREIIDPSENTKCIYCKKELSKKDENCVLVSEGKYAHQECVELESKREKTDKEKFEEYVIQLLEIEYIEPRIRAQINKYVKERGYTYSDMLKAMVYYYDIKGNSKEQARKYKTLGLLPYFYDDAKRYYYEIWEARQRNEGKKLEQAPQRIVRIPPPQPKPRKKHRFRFLDKESE